jgi:NAD(P)-dependent dehydrogenase (short-subunit alcohol dehydrogenase family)
LGAAYVDAFLSAGAFVTNSDIQPRDVESKNYQFVKCDVRVWSEQLAVFKAAIAKSPNKNLDIVVANAGVTGKDPIFTQGISNMQRERRTLS